MLVDTKDLIMEVISGVRAGRQLLTREMGMGSRWHVEELDFIINLAIKSSVGRLKSHIAGGDGSIILAGDNSACAMFAKASC